MKKYIKFTRSIHILYRQKKKNWFYLHTLKRQNTRDRSCLLYVFSPLYSLVYPPFIPYQFLTLAQLYNVFYIHVYIINTLRNVEEISMAMPYTCGQIYTVYFESTTALCRWSRRFSLYTQLVGKQKKIEKSVYK